MFYEYGRHFKYKRCWIIAMFLQLFIARDAFDTLFICLLYEDDPVCKYTGIKISSKKASITL